MTGRRIRDFTPGGNLDTAAEQSLLLSTLYPESYGFLDNLSNTEIYSRFAGEIEARNVEKRRFMSETERAALLKAAAQPSLPGFQTSFSLSTKQAQAFGTNIKSLVSQGFSTLKNDTYGNIRYELGDSESFGAYHIIARRIKQGFTSDEAARIAVLVGWAAETGNGSLGQKDRLEFLKSNVKAIVAKDRGDQNVISGYVILNNKYRKKDKALSQLEYVYEPIYIPRK